MRFLYLFEFYPPIVMGGAEISGSTLMEALAAAGHDVTVLTPNYEEFGTRIEKRNGVRIIRFASPRRLLFRERKTTQAAYRSARNLFYLIMKAYTGLAAIELRAHARRLLRKEQFDVVGANNTESILALSRLPTRAKQVIHLRDFGLFCYNRGLRNQVKRGKHELRNCVSEGFLAPLLRALMARQTLLLREWQPDYPIAISQFVAGQYKENLQWRSQVIYNPIAQDIINPKSRAMLREELKLKGKVALYVGTLSEEKGVMLLPQIAAALPSWTFVVIGDGPLRESLRSQLPANAKMLGSQRNLGRWFKAADVCLVPSLWHEPMGRVVLEAAANGCFVIASDRGALPEVVAWSGAGVAVHANAMAFVKAIKDAKAGKKWKPHSYVEQYLQAIR